MTPSGWKRTDLIDPRIVKVCACGGLLGYFGTLAAVLLFGGASAAHRLENGVDGDAGLGLVAAVVPFVNGFTSVPAALVAYFLILREARVRDALPTLAGGYLAGTAVAWLAQLTPLGGGDGGLIYLGGVLGLLLAAAVRRCVPATRAQPAAVAPGELRLPKIAVIGAVLGYFGTLFAAGLSLLFAEVLGNETHASATFLAFLRCYGPLVNAATGALAAVAAYFSLLWRMSLGAAAARIAAGYLAGTLAAWTLQLTPPPLGRFVDWLIFAGGVAGIFAVALARRDPPVRATARS